MLRNVFRGAFRSCVTATGLALLVASPLFGQASRGKIQGRVTDAATGAPIAGAQVTIAGTTLGNLTNDQGFYFVNEVPAGLQTIEAQFIGYRSFVIEGERILAGQTTTLNFELEQTAVELEAITVEGERNPLVPRDQTSSKTIIRGEAVDALPIDNTAGLVLISPGAVNTNAGITIRGGRPNEEAQIVDGVQVRSFGTGLASNLQLPTNSLEQLDVQVGAFSAEFGDAQSGVVNFVTRTGGPRWTSSLEVATDQLGPDDWRTNFNRLEFNVGGPIFGPLSFFLGGTLTSQQANVAQGYPEQWVFNGVDTCSGTAAIDDFCEGLGIQGQDAVFALPRSSQGSSTLLDVVEVAAPVMTPWANGRTRPYNWGSTDLLTTNLNYQLPRGSRITLGYTGNRIQSYGRNAAFLDQFKVDDRNGQINRKDLFTLGGYFTLLQSANQQLALDVRASYGYDKFKQGELDPAWWNDHHDPFLGYTFGNPDFLVDEDSFRPLGFDIYNPTDEYINLVRSGGASSNNFHYYPDRTDLAETQTPVGVSGDQALRTNPWGWRTNFPTRGVGINDNQYPEIALQVRREERWQFRGAIDWQMGRFNRLRAGAEYVDVSLSSAANPVFIGSTVPEKAEPTRIGAWISDRLDVGDLVLEGGVRWDYLDPNVTLARTPGFTFSVPDSLQKGFTTLRSDGTIGFKWEGDNCGGVTTQNPNGTCISNFLETKTKSEFSPRLGASFPVTPTSTFRLSYGRFVQMPAFFTGTTVFANAQNTANAVIGFLQSSNNDFGLDANTNDRFARDVDLPSTYTFEFGYRQLIGSNLVIDVAAYNKKQRAGLTYRKENFADPLRPGAFININVAANADYTEANGFEFKLDQALGNLFSHGLSYTYVDARGTGSDEETYTGLLFRATTNLSTITRQPVDAPEVLLPLEQSRKHNIGYSLSLQFPNDWQQGTVAGAILRNFGVFALLGVRSGLPYTRLEQNNIGTIGPPSRSAGQAPASSVNAQATPWQTQFDLRFTKGFMLGPVETQLFLDWRNPFDVEDRTTVYLETGNDVNEPAFDRFVSQAMADSRLDGDSDIRGFDIVAESPENDYNKFMLLRAEQRWGNGDGFFSVDEQRQSFGERWRSTRGLENVFRVSNQSLRLGLRLAI